MPGTGAVKHYEKTTYDQYGRVFQVFDASRTEARFTDNGVRHVYNANGYPEKLQDAAGTVDGQGTFTPQVVYRTVTATDARGNVTAETLGNGVKRAHRHDGKTGRVLGILSTRAATGDRQNLTYAWDVLGNLTSHKRGSGPSALTETFGYDTLNRLETYRAGTRAAQSVTYDGYGNVRTKSGVGTYVYGADSNAPMGTTAGPHAVATVTKSDNTEVTYAYDDNGNNVSSSDGRTIAWATFDKPTSIAKGRHTTAFAYAPDRSRFRRIDSNAQGDTTTLYLGNVEKITHPDDSTEIKRYIGGVVIETEGPAIGTCPADATRYVLRDHLGSVDVLTDALGNKVKSVSFDAWGRARNPADWTELTDMEAMTIDRCDTRRGFTNHEMLDAVGVIHMNGRIYDPTLARFLQADPFVQFPTNLQSYNRYSYVMNNPLAYTDPSGYFLGKLIRPLASIAISFWLPGASIWTGTGLFAANGIGAVAVSGFIAGAVASGNLQGAVMGAFSAAAFYGVNGISFASTSTGHALKSAFHGYVGGVMSVLQGGKFGHGFLSAAATQAAAGRISDLDYERQRVIAAAALSGTVSELTGGKFVNGAVTAAFGRAVSERQQRWWASQNPSFGGPVKISTQIVVPSLSARVSPPATVPAVSLGDVSPPPFVELHGPVAEASKATMDASATGGNDATYHRLKWTDRYLVGGISHAQTLEYQSLALGACRFRDFEVAEKATVNCISYGRTWSAYFRFPPPDRYRAAHTCQIGVEAPRLSHFKQKNEGCTPQLKACIRFRFHARQVSVHSPRTASSPRRWKRRNPIVSLMIPKTVSTVDLRRAYSARPSGVCSRCAMRVTGSASSGQGGGDAHRSESGTLWASRPVAMCGVRPAASQCATFAPLKYPVSANSPTGCPNAAGNASSASSAGATSRLSLQRSTTSAVTTRWLSISTPDWALYACSKPSEVGMMRDSASVRFT